MSNTDDDYLIKQFDVTDNLLQRYPLDQDKIIADYIKLILKKKGIQPINNITSIAPPPNYISGFPNINIYNNNYDDNYADNPSNYKLVTNTSVEQFKSSFKDGFKDYYPLNK